MTIEAKLDETNTLLKAILTALSSGAAVATAASTDAAATGKGKTKTADTKTDTKPPAEEAKTLDWKKDVLPTIMEINASKKPGHGREGVVKLLTVFSLADKTVPALEALGKHAEVLAQAKTILEGADAGGGDDNLFG